MYMGRSWFTVGVYWGDLFHVMTPLSPPHACPQSHSDDPPFLTIGTEVSAKYRGAFCEATIKVAKKLVKCKVSHTLT